MKPAKQQSVEQALERLDRREVLQALARVQHQRGLLQVMQKLLEARLVSLTSGNGRSNHRDQDELLTVPQVADALKVGLARAYELARNGLPSVKVGQRQVRVRRADLNEYLARRAQSRGYA